MKSREILSVFNRGLVTRRARGRIDVERVRLSAEEKTNWTPSVLGAMCIRPGFAYIDTALAEGTIYPFIFDSNDFALLEFTPSAMRVRKMSDDNSLVSRVAVTTAIANGTFTTDLTSWTDADDAGGTSTWETGDFLKLEGDGTNAARRRQQVTIDAADQNKEHGIRIEVERGPMLVRIGTSSGDDDLFRQAVLRTGVHSLSVTPTSGDMWIEFSSTLNYPTLVKSCAVEASGDLELPTNWDTLAKCQNMRIARSGDVLFVACSGQKQQRIERRPNNSWSVVDYTPVDGPFLTQNTDNTTLTASALSGAVTLTASQPIFEAAHAGSVWRMESVGQRVEIDASAADTWSDPIRVIGVGSSRLVSYEIAGTWVGTVTIQQSIGDTSSWTEYTTQTGNVSSSFNDGLDNSEIYYRIGINTGDYTSGTAEVSLTYAAGSISGSVLVEAVASATSASGVVLDNLGGTDPTAVWAEPAWSGVNGWPDAVELHEGRLAWSGNGRNWLSISDSFSSFDRDFEGDAGPISRNIGPGAENTTHFMLSMQRLVVGTGSTEFSVRSSSLEEPLTALNYNSRVIGNKGSLPANAVAVDNRGYFIGKNGKTLYELNWDNVRLDLITNRVSVLVPEIAGTGGFTSVAYQTEPDVRILCVRADGKVAVLARDPAEDVICWYLMETDGEVENIAVFPGTADDRVVFVVKRTINGSTVRYIEELVSEDETQGGLMSKLADSHAIGNFFTDQVLTMTAEVSSTVLTFTVPTTQFVIGDVGERIRVGGYDGTVSTVITAGATADREINVTFDSAPGFTVSDTFSATDWAILGTTITGLTHLEGETVVLWADGKDLDTYTVASGQITPSTGVAQWCAGLGYTADFQSQKLVDQTSMGITFNQKTKIGHIGFSLDKTHYKGLQFGPSFDYLDDLPDMEAHAETAAHTIWETYDGGMVSFPGEIDVDTRICLRAQAPRPCCVVAAPMHIEYEDFG